LGDDSFASDLVRTLVFCPSTSSVVDYRRQGAEHVPYLLGIDIGQCTVTAAVCRPPVHPLRRIGEPGWGPAEIVQLGGSAAAIASALVLSTGGDLVPAEVGGTHTADRATGFLRRVGDDVPVLLGGHPFTPPSLVAGMVGWVVGRLWQLQGEAPDRIAVAHPTGWGPYRLGLLRAAFTEAGLGDPALVPRAGAVVTGFQAADRLPAESAVLVVVHLDRSGLEISLINPHTAGRYELITSMRCTDVNGTDLQTADAATQRSLLQCAAGLAERTVTACGVPVDDLSAVLLAGSGAENPLLADLFTAAFGVPVLRHDDPGTTVACGTALAIRPRGPRPAPATTPPQSATTETPIVTATRPVSPGPQAALQPPRPPVRVTAAPAGRR
jgi:hypothetical protein